MPTAWTTARVFISSTFLDMQAERDWLVRVVFPRLRHELAKYRIQIVDIDLRWGVRAEEDVYEVCTEIIEQCRPHFIALLGGRYGWIRPGQERSITDNEIRHSLGFDAPDRPHVFFYLRSGSVAGEVPVWLQPLYFEDSGSSSAEKLRALHQHIADSGHHTFVYPCHWDTALNRMVGLEEFGDRVYQDLLSSFRATVPQVSVEEEQQLSEQFIENRVTTYVVGNREPAFAALETFCNPPNNYGNNGVACLVGEAGSGKSSFLSYFCRRYAEKVAASADRPLKVIPVFVGATPRSSEPGSVMQTLLRAIDPAQRTLAHSFDILRQRLDTAISEAAKSTDLVIIIDAVDQLHASQAHILRWLPTDFPGNVRLVLSVTPSGPTMPALRTRWPSLLEIPLVPLEAKAAREICDHFLHRYRKQLEPDQQAALLSKEHGDQPLYLVTALEELRTLGQHEEISRRIRDLPGNTDELFMWILCRLEADPIFAGKEEQDAGNAIVAVFLRLLAVSREGLSLDELTDLVSSSGSAGDLAALERLVRPYMAFRSGKLVFFHADFRRAVERRYLPNTESIEKTNRILSDYFRKLAWGEGDASWRAGTVRGLQEHLFHLLRLGDFDSLNRLFSDITFLGSYAERVEAEPESCEYPGATELLSRLHEAVNLARANEGSGARWLKQWIGLSKVIGRSERLLHRVPRALEQEIANSGDVAADGGIDPVLVEAARKSHAAGTSFRFSIGEERRNAVPGNRVTALAVHRKTVAAGNMEGAVSLWSVGRDEPLWLNGGHKSWVTSLAFSPSGRRVLSSGDDGSICLWDTDLGSMSKLNWVFETAIVWQPADLCFFQNESLACIVWGIYANVVDLDAGLLVAKFYAPTSGHLRTPFTGPYVDSSGDLIAAHMGKGEFEVRDTAARRIKQAGRLPSSPDKIAISGDGRTVFSCDNQGRGTFVDVRTGVQTRHSISRPLSALCHSKEGFYCCDVDGKLQYFSSTSPHTGVSLCFDPELSGSDRVTCIAVSDEDGLLVLGHGSGSMSFCDRDSRQVRARVKARPSLLRGAVIELGSRALALEGQKSAMSGTGISSGMVLLDREGRRTLGSPHSRSITAICSLGGARALSVDDGGTAVVWKGEKPAKVMTHAEFEFSACAAWREGDTFVAGTSDERVLIGGRYKQVLQMHSSKWNFRAGISAIAATGQPLRLIATYFNGLVRFSSEGVNWVGREDTKHHLRGTSVALDESGRFAASGNLNGEVQLWSCASGKKLFEVTMHDGDVTALLFNAGGDRLICAGSDGFVYVIDTIQSLVVEGCRLPTYAVSLSTDGSSPPLALLASGAVVKLLFSGEPEYRERFSGIRIKQFMSRFTRKGG